MSNIPGEQLMSTVQSKLSQWQAVPIAGPLFASPIKAAISAIQLVAGIFAALFFGCVSWACLLNGNRPQHNEFENRSNRALEKHVKEGVKGLAYSGVNMASLGILGYMTEHRLSSS